MSAFYAVAGYVAGTVTTASAYFLYEWFNREYREIEERDEITRILDLVGMDDELYVKFKPEHLPYLRMLDTAAGLAPNDRFTYGLAALAALLVVPRGDLSTHLMEALISHCAPDKHLTAAKALSELTFDTLDIRNAGTALENHEKYFDILGDTAQALTIYLNHEKFDSIMSQVILDTDEFLISPVMEFLIRKLNRMSFYITIYQAGLVGNLSADELAELQAFNKQLSGIVQTLARSLVPSGVLSYERDDIKSKFLEVVKLNNSNIGVNHYCQPGCDRGWPDMCDAVATLDGLPEHMQQCTVDLIVTNNAALGKSLRDANYDFQIRIIELVTAAGGTPATPIGEAVTAGETPGFATHRAARHDSTPISEAVSEVASETVTDNETDRDLPSLSDAQC